MIGTDFVFALFFQIKLTDDAEVIVKKNNSTGIFSLYGTYSKYLLKS